MPIHLTINYLFSGLLSIVLGTVAIRRDNKSSANRSFFFFTLLQLLWVATLYAGYFFVLRPQPLSGTSTIFVRLAYGYGLLMYPLLAMFFYYFPRPTFRIPKPIEYSIVIISVIMAIIASFTDLVHKKQVIIDGIYVADEFGPLYIGFTLIFLVSLIVAAGLATKKAISLEGIEKRKVIVSTIGCWAFLLVVISTNAILPIFKIYNIGSFHLIQNSPLYTLLFIIPAFYSLHKHRFFNFSDTSMNLIRKLLLYVAFFFSIFYIFQGLSFLFENGNPILLMLISGFLALMVFEKLEKTVPQMMSENFKQFKKNLDELKPKMYACETMNCLQERFERTFKIQLNFENIGLKIVRNKKIRTKLPIYVKDTFTKELQKYKKDVLIAEEIPFKKLKNSTTNKLKEVMEKLNSDLILPLFSEDNLIGFVYSKKPGQIGYSKEEIKTLLALKNDIETSVMNILLKANLQEENNLLQAIITKKTKQLKQQFGAIKKLLRQQADFIAVTAHEFRTPLSIALFQLEEIIEAMAKSNKLKKELVTVNNSLKNLKQLTQKLFDVQQYDLDKVEINKQKTSMRDFIDEIYQNFTVIMKEKKIDFKFKNGLKSKTVWLFDRAQINQVLHNLLTNAYKFTPENGKIQLSVEKNKEGILLKVEDSGKGLTPKLKKEVFEKFKTANQGKGSGIGLGLYLCRKIIKLHQGKIWADNSELGGAAFIIQLSK